MKLEIGRDVADAQLARLADLIPGASPRRGGYRGGQGFGESPRPCDMRLKQRVHVHLRVVIAREEHRRSGGGLRRGEAIEFVIVMQRLGHLPELKQQWSELKMRSAEVRIDLQRGFELGSGLILLTR